MKFTTLLSAALLTVTAVGNAATVSVVDGNIFYSEKTPAGDIEIDFRRCMANNLYTFSSVRVDGRELNHTESDNIGPFLVSQKGWTGGNHVNGDRLSAETRSVKISADGKELPSDTVIQCKVLTVDVVNQLFHPSDDRDFAIENIVYNVSGNSVEVFASHRFQYPEPQPIDRYYGMQSMFVDEFEILTPGGKFNTWTRFNKTNTGNELEFTKDSAPNFRTFIEHSDGGYQAAYLTADGLGDRSWLGDDAKIFIGNSWTKCYHKIIDHHDVNIGDRSSWHGIYSWFVRPVSDRSHAEDAAAPTFDYIAYIQGRPHLFHLHPDGTLTQTPL